MIIKPQLKSVSFAQLSKDEVEAAVGTNVVVVTGNLVRLRCLLKSQSTVNITWLVDGERVFNGREYLIEGNVLHYKNTDVGGNYNITCRISSFLGSSQISSMLEVVGM